MANKGHMWLTVACVDRSILNFKSKSAVVSKMEQDTIFLRLERRRTLVNIVNFDFMENYSARLENKGILLFDAHEVSLVSRIVQFQSELPYHIERRQQLLLESNVSMCIAISDNFRQIGDLTAALMWINSAIKNTNGYPIAHIKALTLLHELGDDQSAKLIALEAHSLQSDNSFVIKALRELAVRDQDFAGALIWAKLLTVVNPKEGSSHASVAELHRGLKDFSAAAQSIEAALHIEPENQEFYKRAVRICVESNDLAKALYWAELWAALPDANAEAFSTISQVVGRLTPPS